MTVSANECQTSLPAIPPANKLRAGMPNLPRHVENPHPTQELEHDLSCFPYQTPNSIRRLLLCHELSRMDTKNAFFFLKFVEFVAEIFAE
jgi:hypothetical protein